MAGSVSFTLDLADYTRFSKLHWRGQALKMALTLILVGAVIGGISFIADGNWTAIPFTAMVCLAVGCILWALYYFIALPWQSRKIFEETTSLQEEQVWTLTSGGTEVVQPHGNANLQWSNMVRWTENDELFVVYANRVMGYIFPKDKVEARFIDNIRAGLIESGLSTKGKKRK